MGRNFILIWMKIWLELNKGLSTVICQFVHQKRLSEPGLNLISKLFLKINRTIYDYLKSNFDPIVTLKINHYTLKLPFSHDLPFILKSFPLYSSNLSRLAKYTHKKYQNLTCIDIGANIGDSIAFLRKETEFPVLGIEGDSYFFEILKKNIFQFSNVFIENVYVGAESECVGKEIYRANGSAHLKESDQKMQIQAMPEILKKYPSFAESKLVKLDTDGYDGLILKGAIEFLESTKPVIFFEYDPFYLAKQNDDGISIFNTLLSINYQNLMIYDNTGNYLISLRLNESKHLEDIHQFFSGHSGRFYADICAFHAEDSDLFEIARIEEIKFFKDQKNKSNSIS